MSVVVPTHAGSEPWLGDCLDALAGQRGVSAQIIVVIDGPAPAVARLTRHRLPSARIVQRKRNEGFAVTANAGLRVARGALVALLNDDAVPEPDWLGSLLAAADDDPDAGSFASLVLQGARPGFIDSAGHGLTRWGEAFERGHGCPEGPDFQVPRRIFGAPACASAYRWELLRDCGGFDAGMGAHLEDVDLSLRAQLLGFPCRFVPTARVHHAGGASYARASPAVVRRLARNRVRLLARAMPRGPLTRALPAVAVSVGASIAHAARTGHGGDALAGTLEGLRGARDAVAERPRILGARRIDDASLIDLLVACEADLQALPDGGRRAPRKLLARLLARVLHAPDPAPPWE